MFVQLQLAAQNSGVQQCTTRGPSSTTRTTQHNTMPCGGSSEHPHSPITAHNNQTASAGHHAHHTHHAHLSPPSSPTLSPGSIHYPHLATGACSPSPRAATPFQQVTPAIILLYCLYGGQFLPLRHVLVLSLSRFGLIIAKI